MIVIIRTRNKDNINNSVISQLDILGVNYRIYSHPEGMTFGEFNTEVFKTFSEDENYFLLDDDVVPNSFIFDMERDLLVKKELVAVCGRAIPDKPNIARILHVLHKPDFCFGCVLLRGSIFKDFVFPPYLEANEDDFVKNFIENNNFSYLIKEDFIFTHHSDDWEKKFLRDVAWTTANNKIYWDRNKRIDNITPYSYEKKEFYASVMVVSSKIFKIDRSLSSKVAKAMILAYENPEEYLRNR